MRRTGRMSILCALLALGGGTAWAAEPTAAAPPPLVLPRPPQNFLAQAQTPPAPSAPTAPTTEQQALADQVAAASAATAPTSLPRSTAPEMLGDATPLAGQPGQVTGPPGQITAPPGQGKPPPQPPPQPPPVVVVPPPQQRVAIQGAVLVPWIRGFKIADDESPRPLDRVYVAFNYWDDVNAEVNRRFGSDVHDVRVFRETFGLEKTFLDGNASIGLRVPLNSLGADSLFPALDGTSSDIGDLTVILKYAPYLDRESGDVFSVGLAVTAPTGPNAFAGSEAVVALHSTVLQPYFGYIWHVGDVFVHGFSSIAVPTDSRDVTLFYNDVGLGYAAYRSTDAGRFLTAVVPTVEAHVNTPVNHRGAFRQGDVAGTPDVVDLTAGANFEFYRRSRLGLGVATPVTGPRPFNVEALAQFTLRF
jgi:hypothetical protein